MNFSTIGAVFSVQDKDSPLSEEIDFKYLREIIVFLAAASLVVPVFHRLKISPVIGYLVLGFVIGPFGLGLIAQDVPELSALVIADLDGVKTLAEFGIVFLLFKIGLELSFSRMWALRRMVLGLGGAQVFGTAAVIGLIAFFYGNTPEIAVLLGGALAMSSTAIVMQLLYENKRTGSAMGRAAFAILLMQDLAVVPLLAILSVLGAGADASAWGTMGVALAKGVAAVAVILALGRIVLKPAFRYVALAKSPELLVAVTLLTAIGTALATAAAGLSMALGAFLAGLLLAESEFQHQIETDIEPFKGLLLGLFFFSVGMSIDIRVLASAPVLIGASVLGLFAVKAMVIAPAARASGLSWPASLEMALIMGGAGEFCLIVLDLAMNRRILPGEIGHFMLLVAGLSMILTPLVAHLATRLSGYIERRTGDAAGDLRARLGDLSGHVIIAGFGRVGQTVARLLDTEDIAYVAFDRDVDVVTRYRTNTSRGRRILYLGDAARRDLMHRARADAAQAVVLTLDDHEAAAKTVAMIRREWPRLKILVRARDATHAADLLRAGATQVVPETVESSLQLGASVLDSLGVPEHVVDQRVDRERESFRKAMAKPNG